MRQFPLLLALVLAAGCALPSNAAQPGAPGLLKAIPAATSPVSTSPTTTPVLQAGEAAVNAARLRLTSNGMENPGLVSAVRITPETWSDDCLGLPAEMTCHSTPTPGYVVELERDGQHYLFRADEDGTKVRLASSPAETIADAFIQWQYSDGQQCRTAVIGTQRMRYGICGEAMLAAPSRAPMWPDVNGQSQASYLRQKYAPFTANTIRGTLVFGGVGSTVASEVEQRAIAEWALDRFVDASYHYLSADYGLRLQWHEQSGALCGGLWVYQDGLAVAWNREGSDALAVGFLSATRLRQFYEWLDGGKRWEVVRGGRTEGSRPSLTLRLSADGARQVPTATADETEQLLRFVREVYAELSANGGQQSVTPSTPASSGPTPTSNPRTP